MKKICSNVLFVIKIKELCPECGKSVSDLKNHLNVVQYVEKQTEFDTGEGKAIDNVPARSKRKRSDPDWYVDAASDMSYACAHCFEKFPTTTKLKKHKKECTRPDL